MHQWVPLSVLASVLLLELASVPPLVQQSARVLEQRLSQASGRPFSALVHCCACTVSPASASALDSAAAAAPIRWDTGVRGTGVGSIVNAHVQLLAVCGRDEQIGRGERAPNLMEVF